MIDLRRAGLFGALSFSIVLVAACGGATPAANATPTPAGAAEATPTPETTTEATPTDVALPSIGAIPSFDLSALAGALPVDSYRVSTSIGGVEQYQSIVVTEPVLSKAITVFDESGAVATRFVVIGEEAWMAEGADGAFESVPAQLASSMLLAFDPALMLGGFTGVAWGEVGSNLGTQEKNGVQAVHVRIDSTSAVGAAGAIPPGAAVDIWVAPAGHLIAWEMTGFPEDANFSIQVTNIDDPSNQVERPD